MQHQIDIDTKPVCVWCTMYRVRAHTHIHFFLYSLIRLSWAIHWLTQFFVHFHTPQWRMNTYYINHLLHSLLFLHFVFTFFSLLLSNIQSVAHFHFYVFHFCSLNWSFLTFIWQHQEWMNERKKERNNTNKWSLKIAQSKKHTMKNQMGRRKKRLNVSTHFKFVYRKLIA